MSISAIKPMNTPIDPNNNNNKEEEEEITEQSKYKYNTSKNNLDA
jgi:hypothetical protein